MLNRQLVLVALDRGTDVKGTMTAVLTLAKGRGADVHVLQVVPRKAAHVDGHIGIWNLDPHGDAAIGAQIASIDRAGVRIRRVSLRGQAEHVIPAYAQLHQAAVLVVEREFGSSRFWRHGRVVEELARRSSVPVLVLPKRQLTERDDSAPRRILTPIDFSIASAVALRTAAELGRWYGARVTLLHTLDNVPGHMVFSGGEAREVLRRLPAQKEAVAERIRRTAAALGADGVHTEVATGVAEAAILEIARRSDTDLILMAIAHRSWLDRVLFGSTLRRVLRQATVPVLVVPVVAGASAWPDESVVEEVSGRGWPESAGRVAA